MKQTSLSTCALALQQTGFSANKPDQIGDVSQPKQLMSMVSQLLSNSCLAEAQSRIKPSASIQTERQQ